MGLSMVSELGGSDNGPSNALAVIALLRTLVSVCLLYSPKAKVGTSGFLFPFPDLPDRASLSLPASELHRDSRVPRHPGPGGYPRGREDGDLSLHGGSEHPGAGQPHAAPRGGKAHRRGSGTESGQGRQDRQARSGDPLSGALDAGASQGPGGYVRWV